MSAVRIASKQPAKYAFIFLHGLGDSGQGWSFLADYLQNNQLGFESTKFIFPNAPVSPVTANGGMPMPSWFDIREWDWTTSNVDADGFKKSLQVVQSYVQQSINEGIEPSNIIVGGFSQGAALSLAAALTLDVKIGAFVVLSGFAYLRNELREIKNTINSETPVFHGHGEHDDVVPFQIGQASRDYFKQTGPLSNYTFKSYRGLGHSAAPEELDDLAKFLKTVVK
ncbi:palmitoyl-(protein) hydrolase [Nakaseomyces bracarensis]|uniref:palmitoyl-(protein) hydrolase n=1 Tax=Nakaseomyces bracarensis TaxID=273131 RepID=UPI0038710D3F